MKKIVRKIKSMFVPYPTKKFGWSVEDFEAAKKWAKTQEDPTNSGRSLWEYANGSRWEESSYILAKINEQIILK